jgi:L-ascorbate metabolism protein UlaG (beta-lactamase superfamily)
MRRKHLAVAYKRHPLADLHVPSNHVAIHWFGQNSFAVKNPQGTVFFVDPYFPHSRPADVFIHAQPPLDESTLPTDLVLLTHDHGDHTCLESLKRIHQSWRRAEIAGPMESIQKIQAEKSMREARLATISEGENLEAAGLMVRAFLSKPLAGDPAAGIDPPDSTHLGFVVETAGMKLYFTGDEINTFAEHEELIRPIAALKPDIGFLVTHPTEGEFPDFQGSVKMARLLGLRTAVPSHYACFVKRTYDPAEWAAQFGEGDPQTLIIPYNTHVLYPNGD